MRAGPTATMARSARGFTLIEILIVIALITIMLGIAVPSFVSFVSSYRATAAINDIVQAVTMTRAEALKRGRRVTLAPVSGDWRNGWIIFVDTRTGGNHNQSYDSTEEKIFQHGPLPSTITVAGLNGDTVPFKDPNNARSFVAFEGSGYPRDALGAALQTGGVVGVGLFLKDTVALTSADNQRTLCLSTMGRTRVVKQADLCVGG